MLCEMEVQISKLEHHPWPRWMLRWCSLLPPATAVQKDVHITYHLRPAVLSINRVRVVYLSIKFLPPTYGTRAECHLSIVLLLYTWPRSKRYVALIRVRSLRIHWCRFCWIGPIQPLRSRLVSSWVLLLFTTPICAPKEFLAFRPHQFPNLFGIDRSGLTISAAVNYMGSCKVEHAYKRLIGANSELKKNVKATKAIQYQISTGNRLVWNPLICPFCQSREDTAPG